MRECEAEKEARSYQCTRPYKSYPKAEEQKRDAETECQRFAGGQDDEEGELSCGGLRSAGSWGPDDLAKSHSRNGEEGCDESYFDPGFQDVLLPFG